MNQIEALIKSKKEKLNTILPKLHAFKSKPSDRLISQDQQSVESSVVSTLWNQADFNQFNDGWNNYGK